MCLDAHKLYMFINFSILTNLIMVSFGCVNKHHLQTHLNRFSTNAKIIVSILDMISFTRS